MEPQDHSRPTSEKSTVETAGNQMGGGSTVSEHTLHREIPQFQHLIPNEHVQLPPNASFNMGHHFVTPFPGYMHAVPPGLFSLNMMDDNGEGQAKRRRRTNYRDPENAAKLTTALGILIKQKEENKPQDLKSIATHFGLPYNTLRDNYLKVTTGKLLKDKSEKKPPVKAPEVDVKPRKSSLSSNSSSRTSTPRDLPHSAAAGSSSHSQLPHGATANPSGSQTQQYTPYPMYHPQMGMHYMQQMQQLQQMQQMQHLNGGMQHIQMQGAGMPGGSGMHHPMMHIYTAAPVGYQINPTTGRPFPVYAAPNSDMQAHMQAQMQAQQAQQAQQNQAQQNQQGTSSTVTPTAAASAAASNAPGSSSESVSSTSLPNVHATASAPATSSSSPMMPTHMMPTMSAMPGMYAMPPTGGPSGMYAPLYAPHMMGDTTGMPAGFTGGFPLMMPPPGYMASGPPAAASASGASSNNASYLAAAMSAAYSDGAGNGNGPSSSGQQQVGSASSGSNQAQMQSQSQGQGQSGAARNSGGEESGATSSTSEDNKSASDHPASSTETAPSDSPKEGSSKEQGAGNKRDRR